MDHFCALYRNWTSESICVDRIKAQRQVGLCVGVHSVGDIGVLPFGVLAFVALANLKDSAL